MTAGDNAGRERAGCRGLSWEGGFLLKEYSETGDLPARPEVPGRH